MQDLEAETFLSLFSLDLLLEWLQLSKTPEWVKSQLLLVAFFILN